MSMTMKTKTKVLFVVTTLTPIKDGSHFYPGIKAFETLAEACEYAKQFPINFIDRREIGIRQD